LQNYHKALELYFKTENEDYNEIAGLLFKIGSVYQDLDESDVSAQYFLKSLHKLEKVENQNDVFLLKAELNTQLGLIYRDKKDTSKAMKHLINALKLRDFSEENEKLAELYEHLGSIHELEVNDLQVALIFYQKSLILKEDLKINETELAYLKQKVELLETKIKQNDKDEL
jgi:tetratricopeptide (TPR) repeat protein